MTLIRQPTSDICSRPAGSEWRDMDHPSTSFFICISNAPCGVHQALALIATSHPRSGNFQIRDNKTMRADQDVVFSRLDFFDDRFLSCSCAEARDLSMVMGNGPKRGLKSRSVEGKKPWSREVTATCLPSLTA